jgi:hypothetical protein
MKYDDAEYYFLDFTTDLPNENGGRHIALFLEWAIYRNLAAEELMQAADALRSGATTSLDLLFDRCDGKLYSDDLNDEGNAFATACYQQHYVPDFVEAMNVRKDASNDEIFGADLTLQRRRRVAWQLDQRYADWRRSLGELPDKEALSERVLAIIQPAALAAGFPAIDNGAWGSHAVHRRFERRGAWGSHGFTVVSNVSPNSFYGVHIEFSVDIESLRQAIYREKSIDLGDVTSMQPAATIPFPIFAEGWKQPVQDYDMRSPGFWIFRDEDIEPLAQWLAERLRRFALPLLKTLDSVDGLALAYCKRPLSASLIHDLDDSYGALLATEMSRHPKLGTFLDDIERTLRATEDTLSWRQKGALALINRIRSRSRAYL